MPHRIGRDQHPGDHGPAALDAVARFRRRVTALGASPSCAEAEAALEALAGAILEEVRTAQTAYEERTDHGYAQCGRFP